MEGKRDSRESMLSVCLEDDDDDDDIFNEESMSHFYSRTIKCVTLINYGMNLNCCIAIIIINHNSNTIHTFKYSQIQMQVQEGSAVQVQTHLLNSDFSSLTWGERHNSYYADHTIWPHKCAAHPVMFKISVCRDPKKPTTSSTLNGMAETQLSARIVQCQLLTESFSKSPNSQPISSGHDVIHTPALFPVWGLLWQWWLSYPLRVSVKLCPTTLHLN